MRIICVVQLKAVQEVFYRSTFKQLLYFFLPFSQCTPYPVNYLLIRFHLFFSLTTFSTHQASYAIYFDIRVCDLKKDHLYSIYIHDYGQLTAGCESAGGQFGAKDTYFNPILGLRTNPSGFIGSFKYNGENLNIQHFSKRLLLSSIIGRSIVVS